MIAGYSGNGRTGARVGSASWPLAVLSLVLLASCEPAPASQRATLLSTPLPAEPDTAAFEPMELGQPPAGTPAPAADLAEEAAEEENDSPHAYPAWNGYDLDCADVGHRVKVTGGDPHRLDRDGDGWGCESY